MQRTPLHNGHYFEVSMVSAIVRFQCCFRCRHMIYIAQYNSILQYMDLYGSTLIYMSTYGFYLHDMISYVDI